MIQIGLASNLINIFPDIEKIVNEGEPIYLTKNGYGTMVVLSLEMFLQLTDGVEAALDEADQMAGENSRRMTHEEIFGNLRRKINGGRFCA